MERRSGVHSHALMFAIAALVGGCDATREAVHPAGPASSLSIDEDNNRITTLEADVAFEASTNFGMREFSVVRQFHLRRTADPSGELRTILTLTPTLTRREMAAADPRSTDSIAEIEYSSSSLTPTVRLRNGTSLDVVKLLDLAAQYKRADLAGYSFKSIRRDLAPVTSQQLAPSGSPASAGIAIVRQASGASRVALLTRAFGPPQHFGPGRLQFSMSLGDSTLDLEADDVLGEITSATITSRGDTLRTLSQDFSEVAPGVHMRTRIEATTFDPKTGMRTTNSTSLMNVYVASQPK